MRGFEVAKGYQNITLPHRKTAFSAGYDFYVAEDTFIKAGEKKLIPTGVKAFMPADEVLKIYLRSSIGLSKSLMLPNGVGVVDADYYNNPDNDGAIFVLVYNYGNDEIKLSKDERIAQGIFEKYFTSNDESLPQSARRGGFGSTGK
jgi:dUTP pyrophosphatase